MVKQQVRVVEEERSVSDLSPLLLVSLMITDPDGAEDYFTNKKDQSILGSIQRR